MNFSRSIMRVFEVRAKPGKAGVLKKKLAKTSVSVVEGKAGNLGYFFGEKSSSDGNDFVFVSLWKDLRSVQRRFGKNWDKAYLPEGYAEIIDTCSIKHFACDGRVHPGN